MYANHSGHNSLLWRLTHLWRTLQAQRSLVFGVILVLALLAFELFNFTTTDFALTDLLGDVRFAGVRWAMILAVAFCGMDFAGIARLFTPERNVTSKIEVWYLLGAWLLAAAMNSLLTWWGVSLALLNHGHLGNEILSREALLDVVPVFVAVLVMLIRILIIGSFTMAGDRLFSQAEARPPAAKAVAAGPAAPRPVARPTPPPPDDFDWSTDLDTRSAEPRRAPPPQRVAVRPVPAQPLRPAPKPMPKPMPSVGEPGFETNGHNNSEPR